MGFVSHLRLHNFRNYKQARLDDLSSGLIVLSGANGAGKTNILEALSLLVPGRGIRSAKIMDMQSCHALQEPWAVSSHIEGPYAVTKIGTGLDIASSKRLIRINEEPAKAQSALADFLSCVWLTPQMDRLFLEASGQRRRFLDRLIFAFDPGHSGRILRYDKILAQRSRILKEAHQASASPDPVWLKTLEAQMAETGIAIAAARLDFVRRLQKACLSAADNIFPRADLQVKGTIEALLLRQPALEVETLFKYQLEQKRSLGLVSGGAAMGPHKSDLDVSYTAKNMRASQCSTGEQKALLIGIVIAHARLIAAEHGAPPMLLLDEVAAHLDESRRAALYDILEELGGQVWLTGTDESLFDSIRERAAFFKVCEGNVIRQTQGRPMSAPRQQSVPHTSSAA